MADTEGTGANLRRRFRDLEPLSGDNDSKAHAEYVSLAPVTPLGHTRQTINTSPSSIDNLPLGSKRVHIYNLSEDTTVYWTDLDGQTPSVNLGFPIPPGGYQLYDAEPTEDLLFFAPGSAALAFAFYA